MKKIFALFISLFFIFVSCKEVKEGVFNTPVVENKSKGLNVISFAINKDANYVNIFRREVISDTEYGPVYNIAELIPENNKGSAYSYADDFIIKGAEYEYCVRYNMGSYYLLSEWSKKTKNDFSDLLSEDELKYDTTLSYFEYNPLACTIKLKGSDIAEIAYDTTLVPSLVFSYKKGEEKVSRLFPLEFASSTVPVETEIDLRTLLTKDFWGKEVSLEYIVGQKIVEIQKEDEGKGYWTQYTWSLPQNIALKNTDGEAITEFILEVKETNEGYDYSNTGVKASSRYIAF